MNMISIIQIHADDNVGVVAQEVEAGTMLRAPDGTDLKALTDIPRNHKVALSGIAEASKVFRYGEFIGVATCDIRQGEHVHVRNMVLDENTED